MKLTDRELNVSGRYSIRRMDSVKSYLVVVQSQQADDTQENREKAKDR